MSRHTLEIQKRFDPALWQVASPATAEQSTLLVTWTVEPEPVDAGPPLVIQSVLAEGLCSLGTCWFAGDDDGRQPVATLRLQRLLISESVRIFRAEESRDLIPAFESGSHNWCLGAQWIVVSARARALEDRVPVLVRTLLESWKLPVEWPTDVIAIVQAGVDGDAAACHCRNAETEQALCEALTRAAQSRNVAVA